MDKVVGHLKDNGSANMSELQRVVGCGRQLIYDVVSELEESGRVKTSLVRGKRIVTLRESIPAYLKILTAATIFVSSMFTLSTLTLQPSITVSMDGNSGPLLVLNTFPFPSFVIGLLSGLWLAVFMFRWDDISESVFVIKREGNLLVSSITKYLRLK